MVAARAVSPVIVHSLWNCVECVHSHRRGWDYFRWWDHAFPDLASPLRPPGRKKKAGGGHQELRLSSWDYSSQNAPFKEKRMLRQKLRPWFPKINYRHSPCKIKRQAEQIMEQSKTMKELWNAVGGMHSSFVTTGFQIGLSKEMTVNKICLPKETLLAIS